MGGIHVALAALLLAGYVFYLAPFYWLWNDQFVVAIPNHWRGLVVFQVGVILFARWLTGNHFKEPVVSVVLHPLGFSFLFLSGLYGGWQQVIGSGIHWKDRLYGRESGVK